MTIKNIKTVQVGEVGISPRIVLIDTTNTIGEITATGFLNKAVQAGEQFSESDMCLVSTKTSPSATTTQVGWFEIGHSGSDWSLTSTGSAGSVILPTTTNHLAVYSNTTGELSEDAATAINGGNIQAGLSGTAGYLASFPSTAAKGSLRLTAVANTGDTLVTISNAAHGQATVVTIPDGGQATTEFIIADSAGTQNITSGNLSIDTGNLAVGSDANAGTITVFPATTANGSLIIQAVDAGGAFNTTIASGIVGQSQVISIPDSGSATSSFLLAHSGGTQSITTGNLQVDAGAIISGVTGGGFAGQIKAFSNTAANGFIEILAADNATGDFGTSISNSTAQAQDTVITIPDSGTATAEFIISDSAGTQHITSGVLAVDAGAVESGLAAGGFIGLVKAFPTTASSGFMAIQAAVNATGDFGTTIVNSTAQVQASVLTIPDVGAATGSLLVNALVDSDVNSNLIYFSVTVGQAALATGGEVVLQASSGAKQYRLIDLKMDAGGTNFSGGGGDRLLDVTDGTTVYSTIPAADIQTLTNNSWGDAKMPAPAAAGWNTSTAAGAPLVAKYSGGTTDYTAGSVIISGLIARIV